MRLALTADRADCARYGAQFSWERSCDQFLSALVTIGTPPEALAA
jgi:hypothetical protein